MIGHVFKVKASVSDNNVDKYLVFTGLRVELTDDLNTATSVIRSDVLNTVEIEPVEVYIAEGCPQHEVKS